MIRRLGESIGRVVLDGIGRAASRVQERKPLPADLLESDDAYLAVFDAPGTTAGDLQVRFQGRTLTVDVDRFRELHDGYEMRFPGRGLALGGAVELPADVDVDAEAADATIRENGTLEVLIPKDGDDDADGDEAVAATETVAEETTTETVAEETTSGSDDGDPEEASPT